ncbi:hypothetical protein WMF37_21855 [Sorangium sp. So ce291]
MTDRSSSRRGRLLSALGLGVALASSPHPAAASDLRARGAP